jgi:pyridoxamine 5'-phosphate oxidase
VDPAARLAYDGAGLDDVAVAALAGVAPLGVLGQWYADAARDERVAEPGAMVVATVDAAGLPNARTVLLKGLDAEGLVFFTNLSSTKAQELAAVPAAAAVLLWHPMFRQVRVRGPVEQVSRELAATYFASRPRDSQIAAWASHQSRPVGSRVALVAAVHRREIQLGEAAEVPLPNFWGGYRIRPVQVELWVGHTDRLHDRVAFASASGVPAPLDDASAWAVERLQP